MTCSVRGATPINDIEHEAFEFDQTVSIFGEIDDCFANAEFSLELREALTLEGEYRRSAIPSIIERDVDDAGATAV